MTQVGVPHLYPVLTGERWGTNAPGPPWEEVPVGGPIYRGGAKITTETQGGVTKEEEHKYFCAAAQTTD